MTSTHGHIVALGGGGFSMEPENPLLDDFVLSLASRTPAKVCFVPTASGDIATYIVRFYRAFGVRAIATDLTTFDSGSLPRHPPLTSDLADFVGEQDIIYVGGGSTANLLATWRVHGLDAIFRDAWSNGAILCGVSAGMICWFKDGITNSFGQLAPLGDGLGFVDASACPHYDGDRGRPTSYRKAIAAGMPGGYAADVGAALHFSGSELVEVVTSRENSSAYRVEVMNGRVTETPLKTRYLGTASISGGF